MSNANRERDAVNLCSEAFATLAKKMSKKAGVSVVANAMVQGAVRFMAREGIPADQVAAALRMWAGNVDLYSKIDKPEGTA